MTLDQRHVPDVYRRHLSVGRVRLATVTGGAMEVRSAGSRVYDADGVEYLDCGGYGVFLVGHCHPRVVDAVVAQIRTHPLATRLLLEPAAATAAEALVSVAPAGLPRVHFVNSGAEATETAIKLARAHGKTRLVSMVNGFHGKTAGALSLTANGLYQDPFRPLLPDVCHVPYGDAAALGAVLAAAPGRACVFVEPVQGEGGVVFPPPGYLREVAGLCRAHGALLVLDEIQTGLGRLGHWWGAERDGVAPDMLLAGKNLSGGVIPVAAVLATDEVYAPFNKDPFLHSSTFAAAPVAMAAAAATVATIRDEGLVERAARLGRRLLPALGRILDEHCPQLTVEVRGAGLLIGIELADEHVAGDFVLELINQRVLVNHSLNAHRVIRLTPPAVLTESDVDRLLTAFATTASVVGKDHQR
ncbi:aspartate aminotransferase family protein [Amycolatopsis sp. GM8]|uniref:aspartate aminotransferase family protein n=1 Tax=Amycolatopsis sp. GM8 TaxID=2896530 RepID=UPI001F0287EE|nr:aminotransferase class III-fold pyridoxal phosphate-dependent enzyme [Amycolatopsis sp. GM8]